MNIKIICAVSLSVLALGTTTAYAESSDSYSATVSLQMPVICKAEILSVIPSATETEVTIRELCNVGGGHDVVLIHGDRKKTTEASYHTQELTINESGRTIIASRDGAYHGKRKLIIPHTANKPVEIRGVFIRRGDIARL